MLWSADAMGSCPPEIEVSLKRGLFTRGLGMRGVVQPHIGCGSPLPLGAMSSSTTFCFLVCWGTS